MTALTFRFAAAVSATLGSGDRLVVTRLDHDANVRPWAAAAARSGAEIAFIDVDPVTLDLDPDSVAQTIDGRTRWVAVGATSNAIGTTNDLSRVVSRARDVGARVFVDAVAAAAHRAIDARTEGFDVVACSAYKWFGPHLGVLGADPALLAELVPDRVATGPSAPPQSWEQGTLPIEALAGASAAVEYLQATGMASIAAHEDRLTAALLAGMEQIDGVRLHGRPAHRTPTVFFSVEGIAPSDVTAALAARGVAATSGDLYAHELCVRIGLGLEGAVRLGFVHYSGLDDVEHAVAAVAEIAAGRPQR